MFNNDSFSFTGSKAKLNQYEKFQKDFESLQRVTKQEEKFSQAEERALESLSGLLNEPEEPVKAYASKFTEQLSELIISSMGAKPEKKLVINHHQEKYLFFADLLREARLLAQSYDFFNPEIIRSVPILALPNLKPQTKKMLIRFEQLLLKLIELNSLKPKLQDSFLNFLDISLELGQEYLENNLLFYLFELDNPAKNEHLLLKNLLKTVQTLQKIASFKELDQSIIKLDYTLLVREQLAAGNSKRQKRL